MAMTQEERDAEDAKWEANRAQREWEIEIGKTDILLPRYAEDIIDAMTEPQRSKISRVTLDKYSLKKELRRRRPGAESDD